ncbi:MAG: CvpA family protein [Chloroflexi bacterium]|nr:CvpA family protein [Chloroflexota bacterium]
MADLIFLGIFAAFIAGGWQSGFVRRLAGLIFMALSFVLGAYLRGPLGALLIGVFPDIPRQYADMVGYTAAFTVLVFGFNLFSRVILSKVAVQGMSKATDKLLGAVFGGIEAALIASAVIVILHTYATEVGALAKLSGFGILKSVADGIDTSVIGQLLEKTLVPVVLAVLGPLLPQDIKTLVPRTIPGLPGGTLPGGIIPGG